MKISRLLLLCAFLCSGCAGFHDEDSRPTQGIVSLTSRIHTQTVEPTNTLSPSATIRPTITLAPTATVLRPVILTFTIAPSDVVPTTTLDPIPPVGQTESPPTINERAMIVWDTSHGPRVGQDGEYSVTGLYGDLSYLLSTVNISLRDSDDAIPNCSLDGIQAVVLAATSIYTTSITEAEVNCLAEFKNRGGGLILLGERPGFPNQLNRITDHLGVSLFESPDVWEVGQLSDHAIFEGVQSVQLEQGGALSLISDSLRSSASSDGHTMIAVSVDGPGRLVVIGDSNLFDDRWLENNQIFATNVFTWVANMNDN